MLSRLFYCQQPYNISWYTEEVELDDVTSYNIFDKQNIQDIIIKLTYSHSNSKIKTLIDVARYKSLIEQSYSCTIRYFDRPDSFCELVTWRIKIADDTLAFLFNKCNILLIHIDTNILWNKDPTWYTYVQPCFFFYNIRGRLQLTEDFANYVGYCASRSKHLQFYFRKWNLMSISF